MLSGIGVHYVVYVEWGYVEWVCVWSGCVVGAVFIRMDVWAPMCVCDTHLQLKDTTTSHTNSGRFALMTFMFIVTWLLYNSGSGVDDITMDQTNRVCYYSDYAKDQLYQFHLN